MIEATLCEIINGDKLLLKRASRGISKGKWNGLGGKIEKNETIEQGVVREVFEESGKKINKLTKNGTLTFFKGDQAFFIVHLFSVKNFQGELKISDEGELKWFGINEIPYDEMWPDDIYWLPLLIEGKNLKGNFILI